MFTTTEKTEAVLLLFCKHGITSKDEICIEIEVNLWEKRTATIFENCTYQEVNKAKDITDKQRSPR